MLDTPSDPSLDRITRIASLALGCKIAALSLIDEKRLWLKSLHGWKAAESPRCYSFCGHAILQDDPLVIPDTFADDRFCDNPFVLKFKPRFYAGTPVHSVDGHKIGTLCVIDFTPRPELNASEIALLKDLGQLVEAELQRHELMLRALKMNRELHNAEYRANVDALTNILNRGAITSALQSRGQHVRDSGEPVSIGIVDIDHFKSINDRFGHPVGDEVIREVARRLRATLRAQDVVGRYGGEEFLFVLSAGSSPHAEMVCERLRAAVACEPVATKRGPVDVTISVGLFNGACQGPDMNEAVAAADRALYLSKTGGRNRVTALDTIAAP